MEWARKALVSGAAGVLGGAIVWFAPSHLAPWSLIGGIALCILAVELAFKTVIAMNNVDTRVVYVVACLLFGGALFRITGSPWLGVAGVAGPLVTLPAETTTRRFGYNAYVSWIVAVPITVVLMLAAWPPSWWWLAMGPILFRLGKYAPKVRANLLRFRAQNRASWDVVKGKSFPDFELPENGTGNLFELSEQRGKFVLIQFSRGDWCPICHVIMRALKKEAARLSKGNIIVVMISSSEGEEAEDFVSGLGLPYRLLRDPTCSTAKLVGAFDPMAYGGKGGHLPATFVVAPDGTLALCSRPDDVATFLDPGDVLKLLAQPSPA